MIPTISALYAALLGVVFIGFSAYVSSVRAKTGVSTGHEGNVDMVVAMRRHGNMAEYLPVVLLLMLFAELMGTDAKYLHAAGLIMILGRFVHPFGISADGGNFAARIGGQSATYLAMLIPIVAILWATLG